MKPQDAYKYCQLCAGTLTPENDYLVCTKCSYKHHFNPAPCNAVIIENDNNEILLVKRRVDPKKGYWDLPGGFISLGENLEESCKREIKEELGVEITVGNIIGTYADLYLYQNVEISTLGIVVSAKVISGTFSPADDITEYKFFPKEHVLEQNLAFKSVEQSLTDYLRS